MLKLSISVIYVLDELDLCEMVVFTPPFSSIPLRISCPCNRRRSMIRAVVVLLVGLLYVTVNALRPIGRKASTSVRTSALKMTPLESASTLLPAILRRVEPSEAKGAFTFFFFAGSGALGIGGAQIPKLIKAYNELGDLAGGPTAGGEVMPLGAIEKFGYKEDIRVADVQNILSCFPTVKEIQDAGDGKSFLAQTGYLERIGFERALTAAMEKQGLVVNPLAMYMIFDALTGGGSSSSCPPQAVFEKVPEWKGAEGMSALQRDLGEAQSKRIFAYGFFVFLIALILDLIGESFINGFFPDLWPA